MSNHLSAVDKIERDRLQAGQNVTLAAMRIHQQQCAACKPGNDWHKRACADGWELAKAVTAAAAALRDWLRRGQLAEHDGQLRLF